MPPSPAARRVERPAIEILLVLGISLGQSAVYALLSIWNKMTKAEPLASQQTALTHTWAADRPWLDLAYQLVGIAFPMIPAMLALYLVRLAHGAGGPTMGWDRARPRFDAWWSLGMAAVIGVPGLAFYLLATGLGINTQVQASTLAATWWAVPVSLLMAFGNGFLEEIVMVGYLSTRLRDLAWSWWAIIVVSSLIRGSYHLYQGFGGFLGNVVMGVVYGIFYAKTKRVAPLVWAHTLIDVIAYLGYPLAVTLWPGLF